MKKQLAEDIDRFCTPIRDRIAAIAADVPALDRIARRGAESAADSDAPTLAVVRRLIGFRAYSHCYGAWVTATVSKTPVTGAVKHPLRVQ
jgi:hypothetical protein